MSDLNKNPSKGMRDFLPQEKAVRERLLAIIRNTYASFGFSEIETPCVEDIGNLLSKQGGENEKLIFKILKRGDKLSQADNDDLCDCGLRFDLTVPLSRYYASNIGKLPAVFKAVQIGNVWRAERPQKGRFRQFMQCDIDIIGESGIRAETELILATCTALKAVNLKNFSVVINDRRILQGLAASAGISEELFDSAFIALDKLDKVGKDKVVEELVQHGAKESSAVQFVDKAINIGNGADGLRIARESLKQSVAESVFNDLDMIAATVADAGGFDIRFDCTLVRGMGYYTGAIFEIVSGDFGSSLGGGGRYDNMLGRFLGKPVPACGFSIGFERICAVLAENGFDGDGQKTKAVLFVEQNASGSNFATALKKAQEIRAEGKICLIAVKNKNFAFQKTQLSDEGYTEFFKLDENGTLLPM